VNAKEEVAEILQTLSESVKRHTQGSLQADGSFKTAVRAALAKNYELNQIISAQKEPEPAFAFTSALRGICEDVIGLKFIATFDEADRDEVIKILMLESTFTFMDKQRAFFKSNRPNQPILATKDMQAEIKKLKDDLALLRPKYNWKSRKEWPTIREMAESTNLLELYDYLYAATSSFVHFSPRNLLRMGWGDDADSFKFSTSNFCKYYDLFNRFYALFLFITFCTSFCSLLNCKDDFKSSIEKIIGILDREDRWPELVTHEEMNRPEIAGPRYVLGRMLRKEGETSAIWKWA
jgi:hypothetical protein